jgi:hypothetical protein
MVYLAAAIVLAAVAVLAVLLKRRPPGRTAALSRRYRQLMFLSEREADKALQRQLEAARNKYPGRSEQWYLEKIVFDLERDRR